jgi:hypothetical protein
MTDFTNLAALVAQGQSLLDLVKGGHITQLEADNAAKLGEVDAALAAKIAQANTDIANAVAPIDRKIPSIILSLNHIAKVTNGTVPDGWIVDGRVTVSIHDYIEFVSTNRDAAQLALLAEIGSQVKEQFADFDIRAGGYYQNGFNVMQIDWDFGVDFSGVDTVLVIPKVEWSAFDYTYANSELTAQSLIKVVSGSLLNEAFAKGIELGKWRFCSQKASRGVFGSYVNLPLRATSQVGSLLIALPSVVTGHVSHPKDIYI